VVPLAAALPVPLAGRGGTPIANRDIILLLATAVIVFSLILQGLTLQSLVRFAGISRAAAARDEKTVARLRLAEAGLARLDELAENDAAPDAVLIAAENAELARMYQSGTIDDAIRQVLQHDLHLEAIRLGNEPR
jgi:CPA1 family monovalent cation:H+ antiporter